MLPDTGFRLLAYAAVVACLPAIRPCPARQEGFGHPGRRGRARPTATQAKERGCTGQRQDKAGQGQAPQDSPVPPGRQETDPQRIAPLFFQRAGLPQQGLKMRSHGFRDRIFFQQHRDRTAGPALSRFCTIPADEHICPAAVQQGAQDPQGLPFKSQFLFPEGRFVCLIRGIQAPPLQVEDKDMAFVRPVRHQSQGIQHPVQRRRIRHGLRPDRLQDDDCPGLPAPGRKLHPRLADAGKLLQLPGQQRLPLMAKGDRPFIGGTRALSLQGQAPQKHGQQQEDERGHRNGGLPGTSCRPVALLNVAAVRHGQISPWIVVSTLN